MGGNVEIAEAVQAAQQARSDRARITQDDVLRGLRREATLTGEGSMHAAHVSAWGLIGKHLGMFVERDASSGRTASRSSSFSPFARGGRLFRRDDESRSESYGDILTRAGVAEIDGQGRSAADPAAQSNYAMDAHGAVFADVKVDPELGQIRVARLVGAFAAGRVINPRLVRSQYYVGMIWGVSQWPRKSLQWPCAANVARQFLLNLILQSRPPETPVDPIVIMPQTPCGRHSILSSQ